MTPGDLFALHVATLWRLDELGRMAGTYTLDMERAPRFYLGRCVEGTTALVRHDVAPQIAADLLELASAEPGHTPPRQEPRFAAQYLELLAEDAPVTQTHFGPAYALPGGAQLPINNDVLRVDNQSAGLLAPPFGWASQDVEAGWPVFAVVRDGAIVGQCWCARLTDVAAEAGVEVVEAYRQQGLATACVAAWAEHIRSSGRVPLYSTTWENEASQRIAAALGFESCGTDWHLA